MQPLFLAVISYLELPCIASALEERRSVRSELPIEKRGRLERHR